MKALQRLAWIPAKVCHDVAAEMQQALASWTTLWGFGAPGNVSCKPAASASVALRDHIDLLAELPKHWHAAMARQIFNCDAEGSPIAAAATAHITSALQEQLRASFSPHPPSAEPQSRVGDQGLVVWAELLGLRCGLWLTCSQLRASGRLASPAQDPLPAVNLEAALATTPVPLIAEVGRASLNAQELMELCAGDVIVLGESLDEPLVVRTQDSALSLRAHLGVTTSSAMRALRWLAA